MEVQNNNEVVDNVEVANVEVVEMKIKKKYNYGTKYKGRYDSKDYYKPEYHKEHYIKNKARYKLNAENRKNKIKEALAMMETMKKLETVLI